MINKLDNPIANCGLKFADDSSGEFAGYASVFNGVDSYRDTILPGAFAKSIKNNRPPSMFVNHESYMVPVGDWISLAEDNIGLLVKGVIDLNHHMGPTVYSALKRQAMDALSIGFRIPIGGAEEGDEGSLFKLAPRGEDFWWVIDPIDGTHQFVNGLLRWCMSIEYYD